MSTSRVVFTGSFADFFIKFVGLLALTIVTFGLAAPYLAYWQMKYFVTHLEIHTE